jgi:hypothetical protein
MTSLRMATVLVVSSVVAGCHTYTPVQTPVVGSTVRVHVPVQSAVADRNAAPRTETIEGVVVGAGDTLALATRTRRELGAYRELVQFDTLRLGMDQTSFVEVQEFSATRSILLGAVIAVGAGVAAVLAFNSSQNGGEVPDPGPGEPAPAVVFSGSLLGSLWGLVAR